MSHTSEGRPRLLCKTWRSRAPRPTRKNRWLSAVVSIAAVALLAAAGPLGSVATAASSTFSHAPRLATSSSTLNVPAYWLVAADGGVFTFGGVPFYGSMGGHPLNRPVVGIAAGPNNGGYWEVASDGGIFSFGDAQFYGSMGGHPLNRPVVGIAATPDGKGYWEVASDGGIFSFGDAHFYGSTGSMTLNSPIVSMVATPSGNGYILVASDGGVFAYGDAKFYGSLASYPLSRPIVGAAITPNESGYWFSDNNGAVTAFGSAGYFGSAPQVLTAPVVGMAPAMGNGSWSGISYQSGSYGYDVSNWQCGQALPSPHTIGVVEVEGESFGGVNPCLAQESQWAGAGVNYYMFLTYGTTSSGPSSCGGDQACNFGFAAAQDAFGKALAAGVDPYVTWWLDVESAPQGMPQWSTSTAENAQLVAGAIAGLRSEGLNNVGIYASPGVWNGIVGPYQPDVPYWMAWYSSADSGPYNCANAGYWTSHYQLPTGPILLTQYTDSVSYGGNYFDGDYAC